MTSISHSFRRGLALVSLFVSSSHLAASAPMMAIPFKPDPPPAIDGDLAEWANVPCVTTLDGATHVTVGGNNWKSPSDLSAQLHLAWRDEFLFLAADVTDDILRQTQRGTNLWQGDHLELYIDTTPDSDSTRTALGLGQFHFGLSPGNFQRTGDALVDIAPEAIAFLPRDLDTKGILVAAKRTATGYTLEAAIPWALLDLKPATAMPLRLEIGVSDTDGDEPRQEKMMTLGSAPWKRERTRLLDAVLSPANGIAPAVVKEIAIGEGVTLARAENAEVPFEKPSLPAGREAVLVFDARLQNDKVGGYTAALDVQLNGKPLESKALRGKNFEALRVDGKMYRAAQNGLWTVPYGPDFTSPDYSPTYALEAGHLAHFEFDVTSQLRDGSNVLHLENRANARVANALVVSPLHIEFRSPPLPVVQRAAPTGEIPTFVPRHDFNVAYTVKELSTSAFDVAIGDETFHVQSQFSTPDGQWRRESNPFFSHQRHIEKRGEAVIVRDEFSNLTDQNLPLMQRHSIALVSAMDAQGGLLEKVWLSGASPASKIGSSSEPANPTSFGVTKTHGLGILPLDDVGLVHTTNWSDGVQFGLSDNALVLPPKTTHISEWALLPTNTPDYFAFVNAVRRLRDVNFTIEGGFAFLPISPEYSAWSDAKISEFVQRKNAKFLAVPLSYPRYQGHSAHGTAFQKVDLSLWKSEVVRRKALMPQTRQLPYFHCFLDGSDDSTTRFSEDRLLRSDGKQGDYGQPYYKLFIPTQTNAYGKAVAQNVNLALDELGFDGIYWDEMEYSAYPYHYGASTPALPWDGVSADIDPKTFQITRLKSSVTLLSQPWRLELAHKIMERGSLVANGAPLTRSMAALHFPRFIETGSISNLTRGQLFTPIALGDHLTERTTRDAYQTMLRALDYGSLYYWYSASLTPNYPSLDSQMFPITPLQIGAGFVVGKERIITKVSGYWGWNDTSKHRVFVFDETGRAVQNFDSQVTARTLESNGKTLTELRLPQNWSAAIIRD